MLKRYLLAALACGLILVLAPLAVCGGGGAGPSAGNGAAEETVRVFLPESGRTVTMAMADYVLCATAGEMPALYEPEALKAQAAACVTLARYLQRERGGASARVVADPSVDQGFLSQEEMRARWGDDYPVYREKLRAAVEGVLPYTICYGGQPILAAFHAISSGCTESSAIIWQQPLPYLVPVQTPNDSGSPGYASQQTVPPARFLETLGFTAPSEDPAAWLGAAEYSPSGTLLRLELGDRAFSGAELRSAFSLRSPAVHVSFNGAEFVLNVTGYGHGVGMSQYGANCLAAQGKTWREIVSYFYPGTQIEKTAPPQAAGAVS